ncbi:MAG: TonB-dependent receptor [Acidobacteria bacterium]|nr:TonB-dependent receptor [Acidobacteriota bacterium]
MFRMPVRLLSLVFVIAVARLPGQDARGSIVGRVTDASGAVVPQAEVRALNGATGVSAVTRSNESGNYTIPYLAPGRYAVSAENTGFKKFVRENVQVRVNDVVELNIQMAVGEVTESVQVTAETPLLSTAEASLGQVIDERRIRELPLFAGNALDLVHLAPGTVNATDMRLRKAPFNSAPSQFSTDGSGSNNNEFTIDGVSNTYSDGTNPRVAFAPPQESIGEFRVQTSPFDATVGHTIGALVNVNTKGGTNDLHGAAWWWLRHSKLDAPTVFQNRSGQKLPIYQDNRYGVATGGPVMLPRIYSGKNKTFWHFTWEANKFGDPNVGASTSTVPRESWRNGDLSDLLRLGASYQVYDPATIQTAPGGRFSRQPFAGNILPASRIHATARKILNLYPLPNAPGTADGRNNFFLSGKALEDYWTTIGRFDHAFSENHRMFIRVHRDFWEEDKNRSFGNNVNGIILNRVNRGIALDDVYVFSPTFLLNFRYGLTQQEFPEKRVSRGFDLASLGFSQNLAGLVDKSLATIPRIDTGSLTTLSNWESGDGVTASLTHSFVGNFTWLRGDHNLRFGPEFRVYREFRNRFPTDVAPLFQFSSLWGRGPLDNSPAPPVGGELVSLLLGIPNGSMTRSGSYAEQDKYLGLYVQDDWKVTRKLTLNLGLRVEHESPITERFNRSVAGFAFDKPNPIEARAQANYARNPIPELPASQFRSLGGLTFSGVDGNPRQYWSGQALGWMPRIGLAYQVLPNMVLRGGYGIFYGSIGVNKTNSNLTGFSRSTPMQPSLDNGLTFIASLDNPFPANLLPPLGAAGGLETNLGQDASFFASKRRQPYAQRWSFGIQQQFPGSFIAEAVYVGNRGTRIPVTRQLSYTPFQYLSKSPTRDVATINFLTASFPSPFFGLNPVYGQTTSRAQLLSQYPHFSGVSREEEIGYSWYHSLQSRLEKRFSKGYTLQMAYTWSKAMEAAEFLNASDALPYESLSGIDRRHRLAGSGQWEVPYGRKRRWGSNAHPVLNFLAGGWQLNGVYQFQSGAPLGFGQALFAGDSSQIVLPSGQRNADRWFNTDVFVRTTAQRLEQNIRTAPLRYSAIRLDSQRRLDMSAIKYFSLTERVNIQFRAETFNLRNEVVLRGPTTDPYNSSFGRVTAQEPPRSWQFSLKLAW